MIPQGLCSRQGVSLPLLGKGNHSVGDLVRKMLKGVRSVVSLFLSCRSQKWPLLRMHCFDAIFLFHYTNVMCCVWVLSCGSILYCKLSSGILQDR